ncbi:MAG: hypothetical protein IT292_08535 [Deltaproteobacteria bacterium]|nr:hypothetical protein [Deltaproteobacteria bacterium]
MKTKSRCLGFSTGSIYKLPISLEEKLVLCGQISTAGVEICFNSTDQVLNYKHSSEIQNLAKSFDYLSIHAPSADIRYSKNEVSKTILSRLEEIIQATRAKSVVFHPDIIDDVGLLLKSVLPVAIENMDKQKNAFKRPSEIAKLFANTNFGFVLDIQHSFENDPSISLIKEFLDMAGNRLTHCHISGSSLTELHLPIHMADNQKTITSFIETLPDVPLLNEGTFPLKEKHEVLEDMKTELSFLQFHNFLKL